MLAPTFEPVNSEVDMLQGRAYRGSCETPATTLAPISGEIEVACISAGTRRESNAMTIPLCPDPLEAEITSKRSGDIIDLTNKKSWHNYRANLLYSYSVPSCPESTNVTERIVYAYL